MVENSKQGEFTYELFSHTNPLWQDAVQNMLNIKLQADKPLNEVTSGKGGTTCQRCSVKRTVNMTGSFLSVKELQWRTWLPLNIVMRQTKLLVLETILILHQSWAILVIIKQTVMLLPFFVLGHQLVKLSTAKTHATPRYGVYEVDIYNW